MSRTITVNGVDVTDKVRLDSLRLEMQAIQGQVGASRIDIDDTSGSTDYAPAMKEWEVLESLATPTRIAGGVIGEKSIERKNLRIATQREFVPVMEDWNAVLSDRVLKGANARRPEETDYQRISWLLDETNTLGMLDGAGYVPNADTVEMEATNYRGKTALDVLDDCAENADKNFYVYYDSGWKLFYAKPASTAGFTSTLSISDDPADVDSSTVFAPSDVEWEQDPERIYSHLFIKWSSGWETVSLDSTVTTYRNRQKTIIRENFKKASRARSWGNRQLAKLNEETKRLSLTVSVDGSKLGQLQAGMRIQVKLRSRGVTAYTYFRIAATTITMRQGRGGVTDVEYDVRLRMQDKIRPVNLGDIYATPEPGGPGAGTGNPDGGGGTGATGGQNLVDGFSRSGGSSLVAAEDHTDIYVGDPDVSSTVTHTVALPDVTSGDLLLVFVDMRQASFDSGDTPTGWTLVDNYNFFSEGLGYGWAMFAKTSDGTETSIAADISIGQDFEPVTAEVITHVTVWQDVADWEASGAGGNVSWAWGDARIVRFHRVEAGALDDIVLQTERPASELAPDQDVTTSTELSSSSPYAGYDELAGMTFALDVDESAGWGSTPLGVDIGAPWTGGNDWATATTTGTATFALASGVGTITVSADATEATATLTSDMPDDPSDQPWGPWASGDAMDLWRWKVNPLGDVSDTDPNVLSFTIRTSDWDATFRIHLGDAEAWGYMSGQRGIVIVQGASYSSFVHKPLTADTWYYTRLDYRGGRARMKLWQASLAEPVAWDIDVAKVAAVNGDIGEMILTVQANNGMTFSFDSWHTTLGTGGGANGPVAVQLPPGDGSTTRWTIEPWVPGTLQVTVDGIATLPLSVDIDAGIFTFDRAPAYGAIIRATYTPA